MEISGSRRFIIGGLGGLAPVFAFLIVIDFEKNLAEANTLKTIGYMVRVLALFAVGGFIAWLHETEDKAFKLFEIGVSAPALIAGLISSGAIGSEQRIKTPDKPQTSIIEHLIPLSSAQAQSIDTPTNTDAKEYSRPKAEGSEAFWEGLFGTQPKNIYYVIAGSHTSYEDAKKQAELINKKHPEYRAEVYAPYGLNRFYGVVIGAQLIKRDAVALREAAVAAGLPKDTYLWTFANSR